MLRTGCETERRHLSSEALASPVCYLSDFLCKMPPSHNLQPTGIWICGTYAAHPPTPPPEELGGHGMGARQKPP